MLNRFISNLPFNPGLIGELSSYEKRLKKEKYIRCFGFILIILCLILQVFVFVVPPQKSLTQSDNDIIPGGIKSRQDILAAWDSSDNNVADIYHKFGLTRDDIARLPNQPNVKISSDESNFWVVGRRPFVTNPEIDQRNIVVKTDGSLVYIRPLKAWDQNKGTTYSAFKGKSAASGEDFWILAGNGDYIQNGPGKMPQAHLETRKTIISGSNTAKPGDTIKFRIEYRNTRDSSLAEDVKITDSLELNKYDIVSPSAPITGNGLMEKNIGNLSYSENGVAFDIVVRIKDNLKNGVPICNFAKITSSNAGITSANQPKVCITVSRNNTQANTVSGAFAVTSNIKSLSENTLNMPPALSISANNLTQGLSGQAAVDSKINPGDVIEYSLYTYNGGPAEINNYQIKDYIGDLLDYADIDQGFLASQGGGFNSETKEIIWPNQTLKSSQENIKKFRIKVKNPLPSTNSPSSISTNFDCKISNQYGNELSINIHCPAVKSIETMSNISPGSALAITLLLTIFSGYFLARSGLMIKEASIIKRRARTETK